ncbi:MAG: hypothetical protein LBR33_11785 [Propionibacteriaceae bacterium]|jgi:hypothetical protein|nr:hypothetical protein [Propionibacteriaceae bacterium]
MATPNRANTIVKAAARRALEGTGFRPDKTGRTWYEDNGWYVSGIDFQPIIGRPGSFLNVWAHFFWTPAGWADDPDEYVAGCDYGGRIGDNRNLEGTTIEYEGDDDLFRQQADRLAQRGLAEGEKLRAFRDWTQAKQLLFSYRHMSDSLWGNWHRAMLCLVTSHPWAREYLERLSQFEHQFNEPLTRYARNQATTFLALIHDLPAAQARIAATIADNRPRFDAQVGPVLAPDYELVFPDPDPADQVPFPAPEQPKGWRRLFGRQR